MKSWQIDFDIAAARNASNVCTVLSPCRYYAILHPMRAKYTCTNHRARKVIVGIWLSSILLAAPVLFGRVSESR
jgi:hypothetical protein